MDKAWKLFQTGFFLYVIVGVSIQFISKGEDYGLNLASLTVATAVVAIAFWRSLHEGQGSDKIRKSLDVIADRVEKLDLSADKLSTDLQRIETAINRASDERDRRDALLIDIEIAKQTGDTERLQRLRTGIQRSSKAA